MAAGPASQVNDWQTVKGAAEPADWQTVGAAPPIPGMEQLGGSAPPPVAPPNPILNGPGPWLPRFGNSLGQSAKGIVMGAVPGLSETVQNARALSRGGLPEVQRVQIEGNPINQAVQGVRGMGPVTMRDVPEIAGRMAAPFLPGGPQVVQGSEQLARGQTAEGLGTLALPAAMIVGPKAAEGVGAVAERGLRSPFRMGEPLLPDLPMTGPKYGAAQKISSIRLQSPIQPPTHSLPPPPAFLPGRPPGIVPTTTEAPAFLQTPPPGPRSEAPPFLQTPPAGPRSEAPPFLQTPPPGPRSEAPPFLRTPEPEPSSPPPAAPSAPPAAGTPHKLSLWHGSSQPFGSIDPAKTRDSGPISWLTSDRDYASEYGKTTQHDVHVRNPLDLREETTPPPEKQRWNGHQERTIQEWLDLFNARGVKASLLDPEYGDETARLWDLLHGGDRDFTEVTDLGKALRQSPYDALIVREPKGPGGEPVDAYGILKPEALPGPIPRGKEAPSGPVGMVRPTPAVPPGRPAIAPPMPSGRGLQMPAGMPRPIAPAVPGPETIASAPPAGPTIAPPAPPSRGIVDIPGTHPEAQPAIVTGQRLARAATASGIVGDLKAAGYTLEDLPAGDDVKGWQKLFDTAQSPFRKTPEAQRKMIDAVRAEFGRQGKLQ
jgi:hypothetical protein